MPSLLEVRQAGAVLLVIDVLRRSFDGLSTLDHACSSTSSSSSIFPDVATRVLWRPSVMCRLSHCARVELEGGGQLKHVHEFTRLTASTSPGQQPQACKVGTLFACQEGQSHVLVGLVCCAACGAPPAP